MSSPSIGSAFPGSARRRLRSATPDRTLAPVRLGVDLKNGCGLVGIVQWKHTQGFQRLLALGYQALQVGLLLLGEPLAVFAEDGLDFGFHFGTTLGRQFGLAGLLHRGRLGRREQMVGITATPAAAQAARRANSRREILWEDLDNFFFSVMGLSTSAAIQQPPRFRVICIW